MLSGNGDGDRYWYWRDFSHRERLEAHGATVALNNANLAVRAGSIHAVLGENGAGKSTLMKIMAGVIAPNEGRMLLDGREVKFATPTSAAAAGVICVFQELSLIPDLSVAENILLANPPRRLGMIDGRAQRRLAEEALARAARPTFTPACWSGICGCRASDGRNREAWPADRDSTPRRGDLGAEPGDMGDGVRGARATAAGQITTFRIA